MAPKTLLPERDRRGLTISRFPLGPQILPKIDFFVKKPFQGKVFRRFLQRMSCFLIFRSIFGRFQSQIEWEKLCFFDAPSLFFQHGDPHDDMYFTGPNALFTFFRFYHFLKRRLKKRTRNWLARKNTR